MVDEDACTCHSVLWYDETADVLDHVDIVSQSSSKQIVLKKRYSISMIVDSMYTNFPYLNSQFFLESQIHGPCVPVVPA